MSIITLESNYTRTPLVGGSSASVELIIDTPYIETLYQVPKPSSPIVRKSASLSNLKSNGLEHVKGEYEQYMTLSTSNPELYSIFPKILGSGELNQNKEIRYFFDMEFVGTNTPDLIQGGNLPWETLEQGFKGLWSTLWDHGYNKSIQRLSDESRHDLFSSFYIETLENRLSTIIEYDYTVTFNSETTLSINELLSQPSISINHKTYLNPLHRLLNEKNLFEYRFAPYILSDCVHNELNPGNTAFKEGKMYAFDPHPPGGKQQPSYDLGKFLMGLSGFSDVIQDNFSLNYDNSNFEFKINTPKRSSKSISKQFVEFIRTDSVFKPLREIEKNVVERVEFIAMYQLLRDMVYRAEKNEPNKIIANLLLASLIFKDRIQPILETQSSLKTTDENVDFKLKTGVQIVVPS